MKQSRIKVTNPSIVIYGKKSLNDGDKIFRNNNDFEKTTVDSSTVRFGINELNKIGNSQINGKSIPEILSYDSVSLWWFCYGPLSHNFIKTMSFIENFSNFIKEINPSQIKIQNDFRKFDLIKQICVNYKIPVSYSKISYSIFIIRSKLWQIIKQQGAKYITRKKIKSRLELYHKKFSSILSTKNKIVFVSYPLYRRRIFDVNKKTTVKGEFLIDELLKFFRGTEETIGLDLFSSIKSDDRALKERLESEMSWMPVEKIMEKMENNQSHKIFIKNFENLLKSNSFKKLFEYRQVNYWNYLSFRFKEMTFDYYFPFWLRLFDALRKYLADNKPKVVILLYETAPTSLAIISACKKLGIKTIGVQHGIIHSYHPFYMHDQFLSERHPYGFQLPDKLLLFGDMPKQLLLDKGYPEERLIAFGNPTYFPLQNWIEFDKKSIIEKYNLPKNKQFILFAPPGMKDYTENQTNYNEEIVKKLLQDFKDNNELFFLIKPHPSDNDDDYKKIIDKFGSDNVKIIDASLIESIIISNLVVSTFSTTIIDSMCLKKPVIQVTFSGINYDRPYDGFNAVMQTPLPELSKKISNLLNDEPKKSELIENGSSFVKKYYNFPHEQSIENLKEILLSK